MNVGYFTIFMRAFDKEEINETIEILISVTGYIFMTQLVRFYKKNERFFMFVDILIHSINRPNYMTRRPYIIFTDSVKLIVFVYFFGDNQIDG